MTVGQMGRMAPMGKLERVDDSWRFGPVVRRALEGFTCSIATIAVAPGLDPEGVESAIRRQV